jgi:hypothetical protein
VQHALLRIEALPEQLGDHRAFAQEHVFGGVGREHEAIDIDLAGPPLADAGHRAFPQRLLLLEDFLREPQARALGFGWPLQRRSRRARRVPAC